MKKRNIIIAISIILILFVPIPTGVYKDGGTRTYTSLTYKIVVWNKYIRQSGKNEDELSFSRYRKTSVYVFPNNFKSIDELWEKEKSLR